MRRLFEATADLGVPRIHFGVGTGSILDLMREAGGEVIGVDWRTPLPQAWQRVGEGVGVQGNLDPVLLFAPERLLRERVGEILDLRQRPERTHL